MGETRKTGDRALLRLGAQMAEVEALYARVLETPDARAERRALAELAGAGERLADLARDVAGRVPRPRRAPERRRVRRTRLERRIAGAATTTEWIIARSERRVSSD
ncbi:hypothetical protein [Actinomadura sp. 21ATH]|uniref:hypothetical protein n=1 Tax=Actinomadura sp. 21ATH TaxID=1735444 RepID=UPI0035BF388D